VKLNKGRPSVTNARRENLNDSVVSPAFNETANKPQHTPASKLECRDAHNFRTLHHLHLILNYFFFVEM